MRLTFLASAGDTATSAARRRVRVVDLPSSRWRRLACSRRSLPLPVTLKRFFAPLCVFIFGTSVSSLIRADARVGGAPEPVGSGAPLWCCRQASAAACSDSAGLRAVSFGLGLGPGAGLAAGLGVGLGVALGVGLGVALGAGPGRAGPGFGGGPGIGRAPGPGRGAVPGVAEPGAGAGRAAGVGRAAGAGAGAGRLLGAGVADGVDGEPLDEGPEDEPLDGGPD